MSCPYIKYSKIKEEWYCDLTWLECEGHTLEGFNYEWCSIYEEGLKYGEE